MKWYLDEHADAELPKGITVINNEVGFWQSALAGSPLVIQGPQLCQWASAFAEGRGIQTQTLLSPQGILRSWVPQLTPSEASELAQGLQGVTHQIDFLEMAQQVLQIPWLLQAATPPERLAQWWAWLLQDFSSAQHKLIQQLGTHLQHQYNDPSFSITHRPEVWQQMQSWLGLTTHNQRGLFPIALPKHLEKQLQQELISAAVAQKGQLTQSLLGKAPRAVLTIAAQADVLYWEHHTEDLDSVTLGTLEAYLPSERTRQLQQAIPPPLPTHPPSQPGEWGHWFLNSYLPYRLWPKAKPELVREIAQLFAKQYLEVYQNAVAGGQGNAQLNWVKAKSLANPNHVVLWLVLDGLSYPDAQQLWQHLQAKDTHQRLSMANAAVAFAPLPTVTEIAKPALLAGVKPALSSGAPHIGTMFNKDADAKKALQQAKLGDVLVLSLLEPDRTYHDIADPAIAKTNANGILLALAERILKLQQAAPNGLPLEIVITTDHGRLLDGSTRSLAVPAGMRSSGRAAIGGHSLRSAVVEEGDVVKLHRDSFGLSEDCAIVLSDQSFLTDDGKRGQVAYPHGGAFPEEVLIPFWRIAVDAQPTAPTFVLRGSNPVGKLGTLQLAFQNNNPLVWYCQAVLWQPGEVLLELEVLQSIPAMQQGVLSIQFPQWPSKQEVQKAKAHVRLSSPSGDTKLLEAILEIEVEEMYDPGDDILGDLL